MEYQGPNDIIRRVGAFLSVPIPETTQEQIDHLIALEACRHDLAKATVEWHMLLINKRRQVLHPKDKDLTELDRNVMLEANVSVIRADHDFLARLEELVKDRIDICKLLLTL